jgi:DNA-binding beta-propeller fold protein YncE
MPVFATLSVAFLGSIVLSNPGGVAADPTGNVYISDTSNSRIVKVAPSGSASVVSTSSIVLISPQGVAVDVSGDLFIADTLIRSHS